MDMDREVRLPREGISLRVRKTLVSIFTLLSALMVIFPETALAHKLSVFAYVEGGKVFAEGYFADGARCRKCRVTVTDAEKGEALLEGVTDGEGVFSFSLPRRAGLKIIVDAGMGHSGHYVLSKAEIEEAAGGPVKEAPKEEAVKQDLKKRDRDPSSYTNEELFRIAGIEPPNEDVEADTALERALDRKLAPLRMELRRLREAEERPGVTEILGGIGYIIGLMGLAAYLRYRKGR